MGPIGLTGPAGSNVPGSLLFLPAGVPVPAGYRFLGSYDLDLRAPAPAPANRRADDDDDDERQGKKFRLRVNVYRKQ
jgi:hypothetical protein